VTTPTPVEPRLVVVTPRQRAIIGELARDGAGNHAIAQRLGVTIDVAKIDIRQAMAAARATNRTHLVCLLLRRHIVLRVEHPRRKEPA
jgi:DNA-binding NarL/FixJ family response regulator